MAHDISNDDAAPEGFAFQGPDAHGEAAMLLVESLIHGLIARSMISVPEAVEIVEIAADAQTEITGYRSYSATSTRSSLALLEAIGASLKSDLPQS